MSSTASTIRLDTAGVVQVVPTDRDAPPVIIPTSTVRKSQLLSDIAQATEAAELAQVPLAEDSLLLWVNMACGAGGHPISEFGAHAKDVVSMCKLIAAADVLIDEATGAAACEELGKLMQTSAGAELAANTAHQQAIERLPDHLRRTALSHVPLRHCLLHLPATLHPTALHAHHTSIDSSHSLHLHSLTPAEVPPACRAAAALPHLHALSLARSTLPPGGAALPPLLRAVPELTFLDLSAAALCSAGITALAAALPAVPLLRSLDLSDTRIRLRPFRRLARGLAGCRDLRTLRLLRTAGFNSSKFGWGAALARCVPSLPRLTALAFGSVHPYEDVVRHDETGTVAHANALALLASLLHAPSVRSLELQLLCGVDTAEEQRPIADALALLTQVQSMQFVTSPLLPTVDEQSFVKESSTWVCVAFAAAHLTALSLDASCLRVDRASDHLTAALRRLRDLQDLQIRLDEFDFEHSVRKIAPALPGSLTRLHIDLCMFADSDYDFSRDTETVLMIAQRALGMPQLRALHLPVGVGVGDGTEVVGALCGATHLQLTVDLISDHASPHYIERQLSMETFVPLFPFVRAMHVEAYDLYEWLLPLAVHASELSRLDRLHILFHHPSDEEWLHAVAVLSSLSALSQLRRLSGGIVWRHPRTTPLLEVLSGSISQLHGLTSLEMNRQHSSGCPVPAARDIPQHVVAGVLQACASLQGLRRLNLCDFAMSVLAESRALAALPLHTLTVKVAGEEDARALRALVTEMSHAHHMPQIQSLQVQVVTVQKQIPDGRHVIVQSGLERSGDTLCQVVKLLRGLQVQFSASFPWAEVEFERSLESLLW